MIAAIREWSLRNLARPAGMQAFSPEIDGLRFIAIVAVVAYHAADGYGRWHPEIKGDPLWTLLMQGHFGVPLFFAISGYIIARPFLGSAPPTLRAYFWRRLTRLEPPYFVNLLVVFLGKVLVLGIAATELWPHLLASFFYLHNLIYGAHSLVNGVAWSLEVEWQFYLLAPLLLWPARRRPWLFAGLLLVLLVVGGVVHANARGLDPRLALSILHYIGFFAAGVIAAQIQYARVEAAPSVAYDLCFAISTALIVAVLLNALPGAALAAMGKGALPLLTGLLLLAGLRSRFVRRALAWWPVYVIGGMCYTIYLYHFFVLSALTRVLPDMPADALAGSYFPLRTVLLVLGGIVFCIPAYLLVERPFQLWRPGRNRLKDCFLWPK